MLQAKVFQKDIDTLLNSSKCNERDQCVVTFSGVVDNESHVTDIPTNVFYFASLANAHLTNPKIEV